MEISPLQKSSATALFGDDWHQRWIGAGVSNWRAVEALLPRYRSRTAAAWLTLLRPELVEDGYHVSDEALQLYHSASFPETDVVDVDLHARTLWRFHRGRWAEVGLECQAHLGGIEIARSLSVCRIADSDLGHDFGERNVPDVPVLTSPRDIGRIVIDDRQTTDWATATHTEYPLHDDPCYAQRCGFPNTLVQAPLLVLELLRFADLSAGGQVEAWFLEPVPVGALIAVKSERVQEADVWSLHVANGLSAAVIAKTVPLGRSFSTHQTLQSA